MIKLSDLQIVLLSAAATRADGSLLPPPETIGARRDRICRSIEALLKKELVQEVEVDAVDRSWRQDGDLLFGVFLTPAGFAAVGVEPASSGAGEADAAANGTSKVTKVLELLKREQGATIDEMMAVTSWLPHSTRAALTGLRKKGHAIERGKRDTVTCYKLEQAA